ncbi:MAG: hypothetical protein IKH78_08995 [Ruminococcus sp.]|nr:hypothetical protein [Ruminococcus sp.]
MIKVASWGKEFYIDLDEYSDNVNSDDAIKSYSNFASNILEIGRKEK